MAKKALKEQRTSIPYDKLTLANNFMFYKVMRNHPDACKKLLEMLLNTKIRHITMSTEESIKIDLDAKSIRLDVFVKESRRMHDIEVQVVNTQELPERARFYAATMIEDEEIRGFFEFLISNRAKTKYTTSLSNYVEDARHNTQWRLQYMTWERQRTYDYDEGKEAGIREKAIEDAVNFLKKEIPAETIAECVGLPLEEVMELKDEITVSVEK